MQWDVILVGAGLANGLIAWRLQQRQPALRILLLEAGSEAGGNHTWSFHHHDLTTAQHHWIAPLVSGRWPGYEVRFPAFSRRLTDGYYTISSAQFAQIIGKALGDNLWCHCAVATLTPHSITLADGRTLQATAIIDGRGWQNDPHLHSGYQAFLGQEWQLAQPHRLTQPILMDATVEQGAGYRFVYTLPLSSRRLLIEDTHYIDGPMLDPQQVRQNIARYARLQGWSLTQCIREEQGNLPITLGGDIDRFWQQRQGQPCSGLRAGLFHATTGYSLPQAVALADYLAASSLCDSAALAEQIADWGHQQWRHQRFFRLLNRMLFLAGPAEQRWQVMQRFYQLNAGLIARFYAGKLTFYDKARILAGKPPVPVTEALRVLRQPIQQRTS